MYYLPQTSLIKMTLGGFLNYRGILNLKPHNFPLICGTTLILCSFFPYCLTTLSPRILAPSPHRRATAGASVRHYLPSLPEALLRWRTRPVLGTLAPVLAPRSPLASPLAPLPGNRTTTPASFHAFFSSSVVPLNSVMVTSGTFVFSATLAPLST